MRIVVGLVAAVLLVIGDPGAEEIRVEKTEPADVDSLDTEKYRAVVYVDSVNKRGIKGFFHFSQVFSVRMTERPFPRAVPNLMDALNEYTMIEAASRPTMRMGARDLLQVPWVFFAPSETQHFTPRELENLGKYLSGGGFLMADAGLEIGSTIDIFIRQTITDALSRVGKSVRFKRLRDSHPIYHSFFDFDGPPPSILAPVGGTGRDNPGYMVGVKIEGRWVSVVSYQNLAATWDNAANSTDSSRHLQFGINTVIFALVQEGGITPRLGLPER